MRTLSQIVIYPVKSCAGLSVDSARLTDRGLEDDRRFMLIGEDGGFVTQRECPTLARVQASFDGDELVLSVSDSSVRVPRHPTGSGVSATVWGSEVQAVDCGDAVAGWFNAVVGREVRLVYMPDRAHRQVEHGESEGLGQVSFADGFPYLLTLEASLDELNSRLEQPVPMDRFRPNLVVAGGQAWEEDGYGPLRIGAVAFEALKPCGRCVMVTTDQNTGVVSPKEPLRTLATYRKTTLGVVFGQNLIARATTGLLRVGDPVQLG